MKEKTFINYNSLIIVIAMSFALKIFIQPVDLSVQAWNLFIIFLATIAGVVLKVMPSGPICFVAVSVSLITNTMTIQECLVKFSYPICWLVFMAFMIARGFIITGLGSRIALYFAYVFGTSIKGLGVGLAVSEFFLAPFIPSNTARGAGIIFPIAESLTKELGDNKKFSQYIMQVCFHSNIVSCTLFLTAMAANPMISDYALASGIQLDWMNWFKGAALPGLLILLMIPYVVAKIVNISGEKDVNFKELLADKIDNLGPLSKSEKYMIFTFIILLLGWTVSGLHPTAVAVLGFTLLLVTETLSWDDVLKYHAAWNTLVWLAILLSITSSMTELGVMNWLASGIKNVIPLNANPLIVLWMLCVINTYLHYIFASLTAHVAAIYNILLALCLSIGAPPMASALALGITSSLGASLTHFGTGTGPVYFGTGYFSLSSWWKYGFKVSVFTCIAWSLIAPVWWYFLGWI